MPIPIGSHDAAILISDEKPETFAEFEARVQRTAHAYKNKAHDGIIEASDGLIETYCPQGLGKDGFYFKKI